MMKTDWKEGDICWFWSALAYRNVGKIDCGIVIGTTDYGIPEVLVKVEGKDRPCRIFTMEAFHTREALCEHYRKVFE